LDVPVVDAFEAIWDAATKEAKEKGEQFEKILGSYFWDGLHLSVKGYKQVVDSQSPPIYLDLYSVKCMLTVSCTLIGVKQVIEKEYPQKHWESLPMLFPDWKTIREPHILPLCNFERWSS